MVDDIRTIYIKLTLLFSKFSKNICNVYKYTFALTPNTREKRYKEKFYKIYKISNTQNELNLSWWSPTEFALAIYTSVCYVLIVIMMSKRKKNIGTKEQIFFYTSYLYPNH